MSEIKWLEFKIIQQIDPETNDPNVQHVIYSFINFWNCKKQINRDYSIQIRNIYIREESEEPVVKVFFDA
jgi:hypothetical protein